MFEKAEAEYETLTGKKRIVSNDKTKIEKVSCSNLLPTPGYCTTPIIMQIVYAVGGGSETYASFCVGFYVAKTRTSKSCPIVYIYHLLFVTASELHNLFVLGRSLQSWTRRSVRPWRKPGRR